MSLSDTNGAQAAPESTPMGSLCACHTEEAPKRTLGELLDLARQADDGIIEFDVDLGEDLRDKIDGVVEFIDYCEARAAAINKRAAELAAKSAAFLGKAKRLEERVAFFMDMDRKARRIPEGERYKLPGRFYEAVLYYSEKAKPLKEATAAAYLKHGATFVRRSYDWNLNALKKGLKDNNAAFKDLVSIEKKPYVKLPAKT